MSSTTTKEQSAGPLGIVGSLAAGFEMVGRHLGLVVLPVLVDLFLWLGPRVSIAPLVKQFTTFLLSQSPSDPATAGQVAQAAEMLQQLGERSNLFALLSTFPLLNVPSLLAGHAPGIVSPLGQPHVMLTTSILVLMAWGIVLVPAGLVLGFLYLNGLARQVRALRDAEEPKRALRPGPAPNPAAAPAPVTAGGAAQTVEVSSGVGRFARIFLFAATLLVLGMVLVPLWMLLVGTIMAVIPLLGFLIWSVSIGLGSYLILHLLFVIPGVLLGGRGLLRATWESILLIHKQFSSTVGLVLLGVLIYQGLGFVWSLPVGDSWALLVGVLGNGCIATGVTAALFVFYQERVGLLGATRQAK